MAHHIAAALLSHRLCKKKQEQACRCMHRCTLCWGITARTLASSSLVATLSMSSWPRLLLRSAASTFPPCCCRSCEYLYHPSFLSASCQMFTQQSACHPACLQAARPSHLRPPPATVLLASLPACKLVHQQQLCCLLTKCLWPCCLLVPSKILPAPAHTSRYCPCFLVALVTGRFWLHAMSTLL